jgi:predicted chitinase
MRLDMEINDQHLKEIMPDLHEAKRAEYLPHLIEAMNDHDINTELRIAAFLAQIAHESVELKFMAEMWGPTDQQKKYEPHTTVSKELGNTEKGDGFKFRGRGAIQITGRSNYKEFSKIIGIDLLNDPDLAEKPEHAFKIACAFWQMHGLNELADGGDFRSITHKINGGFTGLADRERYYDRALKALAQK